MSIFFDVVIYLHGAKNDAPSFSTSPICYGVYGREAVPFFPLEFSLLASFDASINGKGMDVEVLTKWVSSKANTVRLYLVDAGTNVTWGIRLIGIDPAMATGIRSVLTRQALRYSSAMEVDRVILQIMGEVSASDMHRLGQMVAL